MALALTIYEGSLCSCGHPVSRAYNKDMEGFYEPREHLCQACAVAQSSPEDGRPRPGRKVTVVDMSYAEGFEPDSADALGASR